MLESLYEVFLEKFIHPNDAWDKLIEFLAIDNGLVNIYKSIDLEWFYQNKKLVTLINNIYDAELLRSDYYDHLGEIYEEKICSNQMIHSGTVYMSLTNSIRTIPKRIVADNSMRYRILDPKAGTGKLLMILSKRNPNAILFGVEKDLNKYRIALLNFAIHGIKAFLLNADINVHAYDLISRRGIFNWKYTNLWHPHNNKLKHFKRGDSKLNISIM